jgi:protein involved in ribonucleotide reduction
MKLLLLLSGICLGIVGIGTRAEAQNYPWCAERIRRKCASPKITI